jgi:hypothetical protein
VHAERSLTKEPSGPLTDSAHSGNALIDYHSGIRNRADHNNRIRCSSRMGTRRIHNNRTGNSRTRNIRMDSPRPTTPESRSRR